MDGLKSSLLLIVAMIFGTTLGLACKNLTIINIIAEIFLNILLSVLVPFVYFSVINAILNVSDLRRSNNLFRSIIICFLITGLTVAIYSSLIVINTFDHINFNITYQNKKYFNHPNIYDAIVSMFSVKELYQLASPKHLLAIIIFAILTAVSIRSNSAKYQILQDLMIALEDLFTRMFNVVMKFAPIGFFAFFYSTVQQLGKDIWSQYAQIISIYYLAGIIYGTVGFSIWLFILRGKSSITLFWKEIVPTAIMSLASCSSIACIPLNIGVVKKLKVEPVIADTVISIGSLLHKTGSIMGGIFKISAALHLMHIYHYSLLSSIIAIFLALLVGTVMGAIPSGGMLGELLILSFYGLPNNLLIYLVAVSVLIDPLATYLNVLGNTINAIFVERLYKNESS